MLRQQSTAQRAPTSCFTAPNRPTRLPIPINEVELIVEAAKTNRRSRRSSDLDACHSSLRDSTARTQNRLAYEVRWDVTYELYVAQAVRQNESQLAMLNFLVTLHCLDQVIRIK